MPEFYKVQHCVAARSVAEVGKKHDLEEYFHEEKYDGFRLTAYVDVENQKVDLRSRSNKNQDGKVPHIESELLDILTNFRQMADPAKVVNERFVLDGEIVALNLGNNVFSHVQSVMLSKPARARLVQNNESWYLTYMVFDLLESDTDPELYKRPLWRRKRDLSEIFDSWVDSEYVLPAPYAKVASQDVHNFHVIRGKEGSVLKHRDSPYVGGRNKQWFKIKHDPDIDVVIMGFTDGTGKYSDSIGAVIFGQYDSEGNLVERGKCSGMTDDQRDDFCANMNYYLGRVMTVRHNGVMEDGLKFRHPRFLKMRPDKQATECTWHNE